MRQRSRLIVLALLAGAAPGLIASQLVSARQQAIKRTDLLKAELHDLQDGDMYVWVAEVAPGAATGRHTHPTPRFVYVIEGAVVLELADTSPQTFKAGQAFAEMPNEIHNFRNANTTEPAKALGFQYARKGQALQVNAP